MTTHTNDELRGWLTGRLPQDWFTGPGRGHGRP